jgi:hypothetical protein
LCTVVPVYFNVVASLKDLVAVAFKLAELRTMPYPNILSLAFLFVCYQELRILISSYVARTAHIHGDVINHSVMNDLVRQWRIHRGSVNMSVMWYDDIHHRCRDAPRSVSFSAQRNLKTWSDTVGVAMFLWYSWLASRRIVQQAYHLLFRMGAYSCADVSSDYPFLLKSEWSQDTSAHTQSWMPILLCCL